MQRMVLISEIAALSRLPLPEYKQVKSEIAWRERQLSALMGDEEDESAIPAPSNDLELPDFSGANGEVKTGDKKIGEEPNMSDAEVQPILSDASNAGARSEYTESERQLIIDMLERWEDPERVNREMVCTFLLVCLMHLHVPS